MQLVLKECIYFPTSTEVKQVLFNHNWSKDLLSCTVLSLEKERIMYENITLGSICLIEISDSKAWTKCE